MRNAVLIALLSLPAAVPGAPPAPAMSAAECEVFARERSFAAALARHDAAAFAEHLHPGAVFIGGPQPARGRETIVEQWGPLVEGRGVRLRWGPDLVVIGGDPDTALSMGPYWMEDPTPGATPRFRTGRFISTWRRDADGGWHVLFDGGGGSQPVAASTEEVERLVAALPVACAGE